MVVHLSEFFGFLEAICTAIRGVLAFEIEVSTSLAGCISIALYLPPLTFITKIPISPKNKKCLSDWQSIVNVLNRPR
jgi:hypothetical protein